MYRVDLSPKDLMSLKSKGYYDAIEYDTEKSGSPSPSIKRLDDGRCFCLGPKTNCEIYGNRPHVCRQFPFQISTGFEGELVIDLSYSCPTVNEKNAAKVSSSQIREALSLFLEHRGEFVPASLEYGEGMSNALNSAFSPAYVPKSVKYEFYDKAAQLLLNAEGTTDLLELMRNWEDVVSDGCAKTPVREIAKNAGTVLSNLTELVIPDTYHLSKNRYVKLFSDLENRLLVWDESKLYVYTARIGPFWAKFGDRRLSWSKIKKIQYTREALFDMANYISTIIRRPIFEDAVVNVVSYKINYLREPVREYEVGATLIANALSNYLDCVCKISAALRGSDVVDSVDFRCAQMNVDQYFMGALNSGTISRALIDAIKKNS